MNYYFTNTVPGTFENVIARVTEALKSEGFGVLTTIDVKAIMKNKLNVDLYNYTILGACNPTFAYKAIQTENKIGTMLPCNVIVQEKKPGNIEVSAIDPVASMMAIENPALEDIAGTIQFKLKKIINSLK